MKKQTQNQEAGLFKPEVYEAMQRKLNGPSMYRGAEEAFEMFYADRAVQDFLRHYAKKEDVIESNELKFTQAGEDRRILLLDDSEYHQAQKGSGSFGLYIGPRQNKDAALLLHEHMGDIAIDHSLGYKHAEIIKTEGVWKIRVPEYQGKHLGGNIREEYFSVSQAPLFQRISKGDILTGLEKAVDKLITKT